MLKPTILLLLLVGLSFGQVHIVEQQLDGLRKADCGGKVPKGFACAVFFSVDPPVPNGIDIASVVGGENESFQAPSSVIRSVSVILDDILYTAAYDPPLKRDNKFFRLIGNSGIPVRIDGGSLIVKWADGNEAKAKIIRREKIHPHQPQPA
jgi:hypothetical protein